MTQRYLITDVELGSYHKEASLISCYLGVMENGQIIKELHFPRLIPKNELITLSPQAMSKTKIDIRDWITAVNYSDAKPQVYQFLKHGCRYLGEINGVHEYQRLQAVGQGIDGDIERINSDIVDPVGWGHFVKSTTIDTCKLARTLQDCGILPDIAINLKALADYFEIEFDNWHNEKADAIMAYKIYEKMRDLIKGKRNE